MRCSRACRPDTPEVGSDGPVAAAGKAAPRRARSRKSKAFIHSLYNSGWDAVALADDLIRPVMERIGHGWMVGSLDVYQEHEATQTVAAALRDLIDQVHRRERSGPLALGATTEGDPYVLAGLLGELVLLELGWRVRNLGINLPLRSLAQGHDPPPPPADLRLGELPQGRGSIRARVSVFP